MPEKSESKLTGVIVPHDVALKSSEIYLLNIFMSVVGDILLVRGLPPCRDAPAVRPCLA